MIELVCKYNHLFKVKYVECAIFKSIKVNNLHMK